MMQLKDIPINKAAMGSNATLLSLHDELADNEITKDNEKQIEYIDAMIRRYLAIKKICSRPDLHAETKRQQMGHCEEIKQHLARVIALTFSQPEPARTRLSHIDCNESEITNTLAILDQPQEIILTMILVGVSVIAPTVALAGLGCGFAKYGH